jgi:hypothetical protein
LQRFPDEDGTILHASVRVIMRVVGLREPDARDHRVVGVEAGVGVRQAPEVADEQSGTRHEHEANGELGSNEGGGGQGLTAVRSSGAATFAQTAGQLDRRRLI